MNQNNDNKKPVVENISCIIPQNPQLGGLYLGNVFGAQNPDILKEYGIRAVITASIETNINYPLDDIPFHLKIQAHDKDDYYIIEHVNDCIHFIEEKRKFTNVYVHCYAGVSRSSAIVAAYIMWKYRWNLQKVIAFLVHKRIVAKPNDGFYKQLKEVEIKLKINAEEPSRPSIKTINHQNTVLLKQTLSSKPNSPPPQQITMAQRSHSYSAKPATIPTKPLSPPFNHPNYNNVPPQNPTHQQHSQPHDQYMLNGQSNANQKHFIQRTKQQEKANNKSYTNHNNTPIPKVLEKKMSQTSRTNQYQNDYQTTHMQQIKYTYQSKPQIPTSPRDKRTNVMRNDNLQHLTEESKGYLNNLQNNSSYSKKVNESQEKTKVSSRCLIRPKDLPGYKSY